MTEPIKPAEWEEERKQPVAEPVQKGTPQPKPEPTANPEPEPAAKPDEWEE